MIDYQLLFAIITGIGVLMFLILRIKLHAFLSLLISGILVGLMSGMDAMSIMNSVQTGMGSTLGFVATVIGLGAILGAILEHSGGAGVIANFMIGKLGIKNAPAAMALSGFIIAIPVFFDVAFILLVPLLYALQKRTGKSLLLFAIPLLSGLAVTHAFIPPTPGPIAVADILGADLGWVILTGLIIGLPTVIISGILFGKYIGNRIFAGIPEQQNYSSDKIEDLPGFRLVMSVILIPLCLILLNTSINSGIIPVKNNTVIAISNITGHPFSALIIANLIAWYFLGIKRGLNRTQLLKITASSMAPAGTIILITGAGGVFKQMLIDTGAGSMMANALADTGFPVLLFSFIIAALVRIIQGSSTIAMITAAGLVAPIITDIQNSEFELACIVISIAAGASIMSHVNDSGFWMVNQYLGITEKQTFRSWTMMTIILSISGFILVSVLNYII